MMKNKNYRTHSGFLIMLLLFLITGCLVNKTKKNLAYYTDAILNSTIILENAKEEIKTPAISIAVGIDNRIVWAKALGYKNLEESDPADINTKFRVGSSSKAITSAAIGKLIQNKKIVLDAKIRDYVPFFDSSKSPITIRQLASHSSGIRNYKADEFNSNTEYTSIEESMKIFMYDSLLFEPGSKFSYTTYNYTVLSAAIEQITGLSFLTFMHKEIFVPLQMSHTSADYKNESIKDRSQFYNYNARENKFIKAPEVNNSNKWAGGGFISTASDLVKFGNALLNYTLLDSATTVILFEPQKLSNGSINGIKYAIGWKNDSASLFSGTRKVQQIHHGGSASGATSLLVLFPAYKMCVSMLVNRGSFASADLFKYVYKIAEEFILKEERIEQVR